MIPHKINELTLNMNPIKLREYLAAGLPVVFSSPLPEVRRYEPAVRVAEGADGWIDALEKPLPIDLLRMTIDDRRWSVRRLAVRVRTITEELQRLDAAEPPPRTEEEAPSCIGLGAAGEEQWLSRPTASEHS